jgi:hypothetical protein
MKKNETFRITYTNRDIIERIDNGFSKVDKRLESLEISHAANKRGLAGVKGLAMGAITLTLAVAGWLFYHLNK